MSNPVDPNWFLDPDWQIPSEFCQRCRESVLAAKKNQDQRADICDTCAALFYRRDQATAVSTSDPGQGAGAPQAADVRFRVRTTGDSVPRLVEAWPGGDGDTRPRPEDVWRWVEVDGRLMLLDATGQRVELDDPEVQRLIAAAPRLRRAVAMYLDDIGRSDTTERTARALLDEIDGLAASPPSSLMALIAEAQAAGRARGTFQAPEDQRVAARAVYLEEALDRMVKAWDHFISDTSCPVCAVDLLDGGVHPPRTSPGMDGTCPRAFAQQILDGVEP